LDFLAADILWQGDAPNEPAQRTLGVKTLGARSRDVAAAADLQGPFVHIYFDRGAIEAWQVHREHVLTFFLEQIHGREPVCLRIMTLARRHCRKGRQAVGPTFVEGGFWLFGTCTH